MKVRIKLFGNLRSQTPCDEQGEIELDVKEGIFAEELLSGLEFWQENGMVALLNGSSCKGVKLKENDMIQIFLMVAGG